jgi:hypothetical protein
MELAVQIVKFVADEPQPGIASSEFVDAEGHRQTIPDTVPMCSSENLDAQSSYPQPGAVRGEGLARWRDNSLVRLTVWFTGLSGAGKTTICKSVRRIPGQPARVRSVPDRPDVASGSSRSKLDIGPKGR